MMISATYTGLILALGLSLTAVAATTASPAFDAGEVVAVLPDGTQLRERMQVKGRRYDWVRKVTFSTKPDNEIDDMDAENSDLSLSKEELAAKTDEFYADLLAKDDEELVFLFSNKALVGQEEYLEQFDEDEIAPRAVAIREELERERSGTQSGGAAGEEQEIMRTAFNPNANMSEAIVVEVDDERSRESNGDDDSAHGRKLMRQLKGSSSCNDDRTVMNNMLYPHTAHIALGKANDYYSNQMNTHSCSATLISSSTAVSAAHCFYDLDDDDWNPTYYWAPGYDSYDWDESPHGMWYGCYITTIKTIYTTQAKNTWGAFKYDFAVMNFHECNGPIRNGVNPSTPGSGLSLSGYWTGLSSSLLSSLYLRGYPGYYQDCGSNSAQCKTRVWGDYGSYSDKDSDYVYYESVTASGGQSGSGAYAYCNSNGKPYVACVHIAGWKCSGKDNNWKGVCKSITSLFDELIKDTSINF